MAICVEVGLVAPLLTSVAKTRTTNEILSFPLSIKFKSLDLFIAEPFSVTVPPGSVFCPFEKNTLLVGLRRYSMLTRVLAVPLSWNEMVDDPGNLIALGSEAQFVISNGISDSFILF